MDRNQLEQLLNDVRDGRMDVDAAVAAMRHWPTENTGTARIDHHRALRCGMPEVIYCPGKQTQQIVDIFTRLAAAKGNVLASRATSEQFAAVKAAVPEAIYDTDARMICLRQCEAKKSENYIVVLSAGTSDIPVAAEAKCTAEMLDQTVKAIYDVGVAGIHRLLEHVGTLHGAAAIVVAAGMEGALASVAGGLVDVPVIAVPTSVGYGASFGGIAPLLTMLNSCAAGVSVVNIDNGFGAGVMAAMICRQSAPREKGKV